MIVRLVVSRLRCNAVSKDLVVEGIQQDSPLPIGISNFEHGHIGNNKLERLDCVPASVDLIGKEDMFLARALIAALSGFRADPRGFTALVSQVVRKHPSCF